MKLTKASLAIFLSKLPVFQNPKFYDEQYPTDSEVAATMLWDAYMSGDIEDRIIADLGAGTGILGIGAAVLGASKVIFVEKDDKAVVTLKSNIVNNFEIIKDCETKICHTDVKNFETEVDTVLQNPPFGVKKEHADRVFLESAFRNAAVIYSFHKTESLGFLQEFSKEHHFTISKQQRFAFPLKQTMKYHTSKIKRIDVTCFTFEKKE